MRLEPGSAVPVAALDDAELAGRIARDDHAAFETLMRRHNGRLFRVARAILRDDAEAEDALQDAYLDAYRHIADFRGGAQLATWLTRIVVNQALMRLRRRKRDRVVVPFGERWATERGVDPEPPRPTWPTRQRIAARRPAAGRNPPHARAPDRRTAGRVPHGLRHA